MMETTKRRAFKEIAFRVFFMRGYAKMLITAGALAMSAQIDGRDLTGEEARAIDATAQMPLMRLAVWFWWRMYDLHRAFGAIPKQDPWL